MAEDIHREELQSDVNVSPIEEPEVTLQQLTGCQTRDSETTHQDFAGVDRNKVGNPDVPLKEHCTNNKRNAEDVDNSPLVTELESTLPPDQGETGGAQLHPCRDVLVTESSGNRNTIPQKGDAGDFPNADQQKITHAVGGCEKSNYFQMTDGHTVLPAPESGQKVLQELNIPVTVSNHCEHSESRDLTYDNLMDSGSSDMQGRNPLVQLQNIRGNDIQKTVNMGPDDSCLSLAQEDTSTLPETVVEHVVKVADHGTGISSSFPSINEDQTFDMENVAENEVAATGINSSKSPESQPQEARGISRTKGLSTQAVVTANQNERLLEPSDASVLPGSSSQAKQRDLDVSLSNSPPENSPPLQMNVDKSCHTFGKSQGLETAKEGLESDVTTISSGDQGTVNRSQKSPSQSQCSAPVLKNPTVDGITATQSLGSPKGIAVETISDNNVELEAILLEVRALNKEGGIPMSDEMTKRTDLRNSPAESESSFNKEQSPRRETNTRSEIPANLVVNAVNLPMTEGRSAVPVQQQNKEGYLSGVADNSGISSDKDSDEGTRQVLEITPIVVAPEGGCVLDNGVSHFDLMFQNNDESAEEDTFPPLLDSYLPPPTPSVFGQPIVIAPTDNVDFTNMASTISLSQATSTVSLSQPTSSSSAAPENLDTSDHADEDCLITFAKVKLPSTSPPQEKKPDVQQLAATTTTAGLMPTSSSQFPAHSSTGGVRAHQQTGNLPLMQVPPNTTAFPGMQPNTSHAAMPMDQMNQFRPNIVSNMHPAFGFFGMNQHLSGWTQASAFPSVPQSNPSIRVPPMQQPNQSMRMPSMQQSNQSMRMPSMQQPNQSTRMPSMQQSNQSMRMPSLQQQSQPMQMPSMPQQSMRMPSIQQQNQSMQMQFNQFRAPAPVSNRSIQSQSCRFGAEGSNTRNPVLSTLHTMATPRSDVRMTRQPYPSIVQGHANNYVQMPRSTVTETATSRDRHVYNAPGTNTANMHQSQQLRTVPPNVIAPSAVLEHIMPRGVMSQAMGAMETSGIRHGTSSVGSQSGMTQCQMPPLLSVQTADQRNMPPPLYIPTTVQRQGSSPSNQSGTLSAAHFHHSMVTSAQNVTGYHSTNAVHSPGLASSQSNTFRPTRTCVDNPPRQSSGWNQQLSMGMSSASVNSLRSQSITSTRTQNTGSSIIPGSTGGSMGNPQNMQGTQAVPNTNNVSRTNNIATAIVAPQSKKTNSPENVRNPTLSTLLGSKEVSIDLTGSPSSGSGSHQNAVVYHHCNLSVNDITSQLSVPQAPAIKPDVYNFKVMGDKDMEKYNSLMLGKHGNKTDGKDDDDVVFVGCEMAKTLSWHILVVICCCDSKRKKMYDVAILGGCLACVCAPKMQGQTLCSPNMWAVNVRAPDKMKKFIIPIIKKVANYAKSSKFWEDTQAFLREGKVTAQWTGFCESPFRINVAFTQCPKMKGLSASATVPKRTLTVTRNSANQDQSSSATSRRLSAENVSVVPQPFICDGPQQVNPVSVDLVDRLGSSSSVTDGQIKNPGGQVCSNSELQELADSTAQFHELLKQMIQVNEGGATQAQKNDVTNKLSKYLQGMGNSNTASSSNTQVSSQATLKPQASTSSVPDTNLSSSKTNDTCPKSIIPSTVSALLNSDDANHQPKHVLSQIMTTPSSASINEPAMIHDTYPKSIIPSTVSALLNSDDANHQPKHVLSQIMTTPSSASINEPETNNSEEEQSSRGGISPNLTAVSRSTGSCTPPQIHQMPRQHHVSLVKPSGSRDLPSSVAGSSGAQGPSASNCQSTNIIQDNPTHFASQVPLSSRQMDSCKDNESKRTATDRTNVGFTNLSAANTSPTVTMQPAQMPTLSGTSSMDKPHTTESPAELGSLTDFISDLDSSEFPIGMTIANVTSLATFETTDNSSIHNIFENPFPDTSITQNCGTSQQPEYISFGDLDIDDIDELATPPKKPHLDLNPESRALHEEINKGPKPVVCLLRLSAQNIRERNAWLKQKKKHKHPKKKRRSLKRTRVIDTKVDGLFGKDSESACDSDDDYFFKKKKRKTMKKAEIYLAKMASNLDSDSDKEYKNKRSKAPIASGDEDFEYDPSEDVSLEDEDSDDESHSSVSSSEDEGDAITVKRTRKRIKLISTSDSDEDMEEAKAEDLSALNCGREDNTRGTAVDKNAADDVTRPDTSETVDRNIETNEAIIPGECKDSMPNPTSPNEQSSCSGHENNPDVEDMHGILDGIPSEELWDTLVERRAVNICECGLIFQDQPLFYLHRSSHTTNNILKCAMCRKTLQDPHEFLAHFFEGHDNSS